MMSCNACEAFGDEKLAFKFAKEVSDAITAGDFTAIRLCELCLSMVELGVVLGQLGVELSVMDKELN